MRVHETNCFAPCGITILDFFSGLSKLSDRAIYFACVNFYLFYIFLMIFRRQIISGSAGPIFAIFSPNESVLGADDRSGPLFPISQGTLPWQPILWQNCAKITYPCTYRSDIPIRNWILLPQLCILKVKMMPPYRVKIS